MIDAFARIIKLYRMTVLRLNYKLLIMYLEIKRKRKERANFLLLLLIWARLACTFFSFESFTWVLQPLVLRHDLDLAQLKSQRTRSLIGNCEGLKLEWMIQARLLYIFFLSRILLKIFNLYIVLLRFGSSRSVGVQVLLDNISLIVFVLCVTFTVQPRPVKI